VNHLTKKSIAKGHIEDHYIRDETWVYRISDPKYIDLYRWAA